METVIINENNLEDADILEESHKVRAILRDGNKILIANYGGVYLLPGGSVDEGETKESAIIRELKEETGILYSSLELENILKIIFYQKDYPLRRISLVNRLLVTDYYIGEYKGLNLDNMNRTEKETRDGFNLKLVDIKEIEKLISEKSDNPRKVYFDRELEEVIKVLRK